MNSTELKPIQINAGITLYDTMLMGVLWSAFNMVPLVLVFIWIRRYKIRLYLVSKREICNRIQKRVKESSSHTTDDNKATGYAMGKWYFMSISNGGEEEYTHIWIIATEASYNKLTADTDDDTPVIVIGPSGESIETPAKKLKILDRHGSYTNLWYRTRYIKNFDLVPRPEQSTIIEDIKAYYTQHKCATVLIHGPPCTGKSLVGLFLADFYGGGYCNSCAPWEPGDNITEVLEDADPNKDKPIIVAMDEIDVAIGKVHNEIQPHKNIHIVTRDKTGWNRFMDNFQRGLYPNVILLLTSNKPPEEIAKLDSSYLRPGRVNLFFKMSTKMD
jgi:ATPase family associated with various cellular activities (AAA)